MAPNVIKITESELTIFQSFYIKKTNNISVLLKVIYIETLTISRPFIPVTVYNTLKNE